MRCESPTQICVKPASSLTLAKWIIFCSGSVGKSPTPNSIVLNFDSPSTTRFARSAFGRRRLLAASGHAHDAVDDHVGNARQIAFGERVQRILRHRTGDLVHQDEIRG